MSDIEMEDSRAVFGPAPKRGLRHYASTSMDRRSLTEMYQSPFIEFTVGDNYEGRTTIRLAVNAEGYTLMLKLMDMLHKEVNKDEIALDEKIDLMPDADLSELREKLYGSGWANVRELWGFDA